MSLTWTALPDTGGVDTSTPDVVANDNAGYNACPSNVYSYSDNARLNSAPASGASAPISISSDILFEIRAKVRRIQLGSRFSTDGNFYLGITQTLTANINLWDYCLNISSTERRIGRVDHPNGSALVFETGSAGIFPPRPTYWRHGIWTDTDQTIRLQGINGTFRYLIDDALIYVSAAPIPPGQTFYLATLFDCHYQELFDVEIITGSNVLAKGNVTIGPNVGADCAGSFPLPDGVVLPAGLTSIQAAVSQMPPLPQDDTDPIPTRFQESVVNWGEFEQQFGTGIQQRNTLQASPVRRFEIDWDGLTPEQAAVLDAHYERSHMGIPFSIRHEHTGEIVSNCRYASYTRGDHTRYWVQSRAAVIVRYL